MAGMDDAAPIERSSGGGVALRLFVALPVDANATDLLLGYGERVASAHPGARVYDADSLHVTVAFLGDVPEEHVPAMAHIVDDAARGIPGATALTTTGAGIYGSGHALAVDVDADLLVLLSAARDRILTATTPWAPGTDQRAWHPHATVARAGAGALFTQDVLDRVGMPPALTWLAPELRLYASLPGLGSRQRRVLHVARLGSVPSRPS
ncbi:MAG: 2-5 ligase [Thermoleophilia bacterium]|jgi:2'-5' RNA ligase|nr:2-5 ligase [Thermoleophilia bacterium]